MSAFDNLSVVLDGYKWKVKELFAAMNHSLTHLSHAILANPLLTIENRLKLAGVYYYKKHKVIATATLLYIATNLPKGKNWEIRRLERN